MNSERNDIAFLIGRISIAWIWSQKKKKKENSSQSRSPRFNNHFIKLFAYICDIDSVTFMLRKFFLFFTNLKNIQRLKGNN